MTQYYRIGICILVTIIFGCTKDPDTTQVPPNVPATLTATAISTSEIGLAWTDNSNNEEGFRVERKTVSGSFAAIANLGKNTTSFRDQGLEKNTTYIYRIFAVNGAGESPGSNEATATTLNDLPAAATNLVATAVSLSQVDLKWEDKADNETGYKLERKTSSGSYVQVISLPANTSSYSDKGLTANTSYTYRVIAFNLVGNGNSSNEANATTFPDIVSGMVAYFPFSGNTIDSSGNNNEGINSGATLSTDRFGNADRAYAFNGLNSFINIKGNSLCTPVSDVSISVWILVTDWTDIGGYFQASIIEEGGVQHYYHLQVGPQRTSASGPSSVNFQFNARAYSSDINNTINRSQWYNVVLTKTGSTGKIYLDGNLIYSGPGYAYGSEGCPGSFFLGRETTPKGQWFFKGKIDDLRIYSRVLTDTEIKFLAAN